MQALFLLFTHISIDIHLSGAFIWLAHGLHSYRLFTHTLARIVKKGIDIMDIELFNAWLDNRLGVEASRLFDETTWFVLFLNGEAIEFCLLD